MEAQGTSDYTVHYGSRWPREATEMYVYKN